MSKGMDAAYHYLGNSYRHLYPERPRPTLRDRLIESGHILPIENRPTLRLDVRGNLMASMHQLHYGIRLDAHLRNPALSPDPREEPWTQDSRAMP